MASSDPCSAECPVEWLDIASIRPAPYNPRRIDEAQFAELRRSLATLGCVIPILVNRRNLTIIAGHQRTRAMAANGEAKVPCFLLDGICDADEMLFNQYHNSTDFYTRPGACRYDGEVGAGRFTAVPPSRFSFPPGSPAAIVDMVCRQLVKYGNCLSAVLCGGVVVAGANYVRACSLLGLPCNCYRLDDSLRDEAEAFFSKAYGVFCYDGIERRTYIQGLAQMHRNPGRDDGGKRNASSLYETAVLPALAADPSWRPSILDFGCGKGAYVGVLRSKGYEALGLEFFNQNGRSIDAAAGNRMIDAIVRHLRERGLFGLVVCDSVVNSVDSPEAENAVLTCLNAFSATGRAFVSGRSLENIRCNMRIRRCCKKRGSVTVGFLDEDGFTAKYRGGSWYFQHFHTEESARASFAKAGFRVVRFMRALHSSWQAELARERMPTDGEIRAAIGFEFDLPLPGGRRYNRHGEVIDAYFGRNHANG